MLAEITNEWSGKERLWESHRGLRIRDFIVEKRGNRIKSSHQSIEGGIKENDRG